MFEVHKAGFPDAVVWNPWVAKAQAMADFGDEEYKVRHRGLHDGHYACPVLQETMRWWMLAAVS